MNYDKRCELIRGRVLDDQAKLTGFNGFDIVADAEILRGLQDVESQQIRAGKLTRGRLERLRFPIDDLELLAGRILPVERTEEERADAVAFYGKLPPSGGQTGHCALHWEELWEIGLGGLRKKTAKPLKS